MVDSVNNEEQEAGNVDARYGRSLVSRSYATPPVIAAQITPEEHAAIDGAIKARTQLFASSIATLVSAAAGAIFGVLWGYFSGARLWAKTIGSAAAAGIGGLLISNMTWNPRSNSAPPISTPMSTDLPEAAEQPARASQVSKLEERNAAEQSAAVQR